MREEELFAAHGVPTGLVDLTIEQIGPPQVPSDLERFWSKVDRDTDPDGCWLWRSERSGLGYGVYRWGQEREYAHRIAYEGAIRQLLPGELVVHLPAPECGQRACCNPAHLRASNRPAMALVAREGPRLADRDVHKLSTG